MMFQVDLEPPRSLDTQSPPAPIWLNVVALVVILLFLVLVILMAVIRLRQGVKSETHTEKES